MPPWWVGRCLTSTDEAGKDSESTPMMAHNAARVRLSNSRLKSAVRAVGRLRTWYIGLAFTLDRRMGTRSGTLKMGNLSRIDVCSTRSLSKAVETNASEPIGTPRTTTPSWTTGMRVSPVLKVKLGVNKELFSALNLRPRVEKRRWSVRNTVIR